MAADTPDQNLSQYFSVCNDFIHAARLREGNVLIHCLAGMSRSVTVAVAYIMTATNLNWKDALKVVRTGRAVANPNVGFQTQLQEFEMYRLAEERRRLRERFPSTALEQLDRAKCLSALDNYEELLQNKDICEGNCVRGEKCPTGAVIVDLKDNAKSQDTSSLGSDSTYTNINLSYTLSFVTEQWKDLKDRSFRNKKQNHGQTKLNLSESQCFEKDKGVILMKNVKIYEAIENYVKKS